MTSDCDSLEEALSSSWDAIVIGTGMGGSTIGWALARAGWRVLFVEQGENTTSSRNIALQGGYPELKLPIPGASLAHQNAALLAASGRYFHRLTDYSGTKARVVIPFLGAGTGGSSALYGMALERFFPSDFEPRRFHPSASGAAVVEQWPVTFEEFLPFYASAERLYRVRGGGDPLREKTELHGRLATIPWTAPMVHLADHLLARGLHPYSLPMACDFAPGCESCQGMLCQKTCKVDAASACLTPACRDYGALLLDRCLVQRLVTEGDSVNAIECSRDGQTIRLKGRIVFLAAGALRTPDLLLRSADSKRPEGLANRSGLVGRLLMRHLIDVYMVAPGRDYLGIVDNRRKEIAFNDFYVAAEGKLGTVQSFGRLPPPAMIVGALLDDMRYGPLAPLRSLLRWAQPVVERAIRPMIERSLGLASQVEDLPYLHNRVEPDFRTGPGTLQMRYEIPTEGKRRVQAMRKLMQNALEGRNFRLLKQTENNQRLAHVCGTCRFGDDWKTSVLDRFNRVHDIDNLYILDASFFPSSGGTNPSLTIAANALRVAQYLTDKTILSTVA